MNSYNFIVSAIVYTKLGCFLGGILWMVFIFLYWLEFHFPWNKEGRARVISDLEKAQIKAKETPGVLSFVSLIFHLIYSMPTLRPITSILIGILLLLVITI